MPLTHVAAPLTRLLHLTWWALLLRGLLAIAFGVLTWLQPALSMAALVLSFGLFVLVDGVLAVYAAWRGRHADRHWWLVLLWGLAGVVVGVLSFVAPAVTAVVMTLYIGAWALVTGLVQLVAAVRLRREMDGEWLLIVLGLVSVVFGIYTLLQPQASLLALLGVLATYAVVLGLLLVALAWRVRQARQRLRQSL